MKPEEASAKKPRNYDLETRRFIKDYAKVCLEDLILPKDGIDDLIRYTREHHNTVLLIEHLRSFGGEESVRLAPGMTPLIADALECGWKKRPHRAKDPAYYRHLHETIKGMLSDSIVSAKALAKKLGAADVVGGASLIAAHLLEIDPGKLDLLMYPRKGRNRKG